MDEIPENDEMTKREIQMKAYELYMARYNSIHQAFYTDLRFYTGLIAAVLGGTVVLVRGELAGLPNLSNATSALLLLIGGLTASLLAFFGRRGVRHSYVAWIRTVSTLIKLESDLGLSLPRSTDPVAGGKGFWPHESYIFPSWVSGWNCYDGSISFVEAKSKLGYAKTANQLFTTALCVGAVLAAIGLILLGTQGAIWSAPACK